MCAPLCSRLSLDNYAGKERSSDKTNNDYNGTAAAETLRQHDLHLQDEKVSYNEGAVAKIRKRIDERVSLTSADESCIPALPLTGTSLLPDLHRCAPPRSFLPARIARTLARSSPPPLP